MKTGITILFIIFFFIQSAKTQCLVPYSLDCDEASLNLVTPDQLDGIACTMYDAPNKTKKDPFCSTGGSVHNVIWYGMVTGGGTVDMTITFYNCTVNGNGAQLGIFTDCDNIEVNCNPNCGGPGARNLIFNTEAGKNYYLVMDGCSGDVCSYSINIGGNFSPPPGMNTLTYINNESDKIIDICEIGCDKTFFVNKDKVWKGYYEWTINGNKINDQHDRSIKTKFDQEGTFDLCVTGFSNMNANGTYFSKTATQCSKVNVKKLSNFNAKPIVVCHNNVPFLWHNVSINSSGEYRKTFIANNCCEFDSIVQVTVLDKPEPGIVHYMNFNSVPYIEPTTKYQYAGCNTDLLISLPKSTKYIQCDSSYYLNSATPIAQSSFNVVVKENKYLIEPEIDFLDLCGVEIGTLSYQWYESNKPLNLISNSKNLELINKKEVCLQYTVNAKFGNTKDVVLKTFCDPLFLDFYTTTSKICVGSAVQFFNYSVSNIKNWQWEIEGASPRTSTEKNPIFKFTKPGLYTVKFKTQNSLGAYQITKVDFLNVHSSIECPKKRKLRLIYDESQDLETLKNEDNTNFRITPNPNDGGFIIDQLPLDISNVSIEVFDLFGTLVKKIQQNVSLNGSINLNATYLKNGSYYIRVHSDEFESIQRFFIEK